MRKTVFFLLVTCHLSLFSQTISFPTPEIRVDTIKPLQGSGVTIMRPTTQINKFTIQGNRVPPTFYLQILDSIGYNRFGVSKNGMLISGTHHDPQVNIDGLTLLGRKNALKGADAFAIGKGVTNLADTAGAVGYYFSVPATQNNTLTVGYGGNRIEMAADSGRFIGKWKLGSGSGGITTETDPTVPATVKAITSTNISNWNTAFTNNHTHTNKTVLDGITATYISNWNTAFGWGNHATSGYLKTETDPAWTAASPNYYTKTNLSSSGGSSVHWENITNKSNAARSVSGLIALPSGSTTSRYLREDGSWVAPPTGTGGISSVATSNSASITFSGDGTAATPLTATATLTETDPTVPANVKAITAANIAAWNAPSWASITGKPAFATVATSGSYTDLSNKPTIPAAFTLPAATTTVLGGVKVGAGLSVTADGTLSASGTGTETDPIWTAAAANYYTKTNMQASGGAQLHWANITFKTNTSRGVAGLVTLPTGNTWTRFLREDGTWREVGTNIDIYVNPEDGLDSNTGDNGSPVQTLAKAVSLMLPLGETNLHIQGSGQFAENFVMTRKGMITIIGDLTVSGYMNISNVEKLYVNGVLTVNGTSASSLSGILSSHFKNVSITYNLTVTDANVYFEEDVNIGREALWPNGRVYHCGNATFNSAPSMNGGYAWFAFEPNVFVDENGGGRRGLIEIGHGRQVRNPIFEQATEPDIPRDSFAFWVNGSTYWLILDSDGIQKKVQLQ